jgi:hypothetical protein
VIVRERRQTELGQEVKCSCCGEFWPEDSEFYFMQHGKAHSWCKACYRSDDKVLAKVERWAAKQRKREAVPAARADWASLQEAFR